MKKLLLWFMFLLLMIPAMSQTNVNVNGLIMDSENLNFIPNHPVYIISDSSYGFVYYNVAYTNQNGYYSDSIPVPGGSSGTLYIETFDCNNVLHQATFNFTPANLNFSMDFTLCNSNAPCVADLYYYAYANRTFAFYDYSTGDPTTWSWNFGDGTTSTEQNPLHVYSANGMYYVSLFITNPSTGCQSTTGVNVYVSESIGSCNAFFLADPDSSNNPPYTVNFIDYSNGYMNTWTWNFGDGTTQTVTLPMSPNVSHTYAQPGIYLACLTVVGTDSTCYDTFCDTIIIGSGGGCMANFTYSSSPNTSVPTQFTDLSQASGGGPITLWHWVFDDIASGSSNTSELRNPTHLFAAPGYHNVSLYISGEDTTCHDMIYKTVFVESITPIFVSITGTVTNTTTGNPLPNHAVTWGIPGDTLIGHHTVYSNSNGIYTDSIQLPLGMLYGTYYMWTDYCDLVSWSSSDFGPNHYDLQWDLNLPCDQNQLCHAKMKVSSAGLLTVQFEDKSTEEPTSRIWDFGDGETSTLVNPIHTYSTQGDFVATLSITNNVYGCTGSTSETIHFSDSVLCNARFSYSDTINSRTIQFQDLSSGGSGIRFWDFGDGVKSTLANPIHTYKYPGLYLINLSISNNDSSCWDGESKAILVDYTLPGCQANFTYIPETAGSFNINFNDQSSGYPEYWLWSFGDSTYSTERNPVHAYPGPGTYNACVTISGNGCTSTFCLNVFVEDSLVYHQIYGQVFAGNFPVQSGQVLIFSLDSTENYSPYVDACDIDTNGVYYFTMVPEGNYLIYAIPADSSGYLPAYYGDALYWAQATIIVLGEPVNPYKINLIPSGNLQYGPGSVSGQVNMGNPRNSMMDKMIMLLLDKDGNAISFGRVSESGSFDFQAMDYGTYYLHAEMSGITTDNIQVVLSPEKPHADVVMTFVGKHILGINNMITELQAGAIYPNPATEKFNIAVNLTEASAVKVDIFNQTGQLVSSIIKSLGSGQTLLTLSATGMSPGFYTLRISSDKGINLSRKLLITR